MASKARDLQHASEKEAALQDQLVLQFERDLERVLRQTDRILRDLIRQFDAKDDHFVRTRASLSRALRMRADIVKAIEDHGFSELATRATSSELQPLTEAVMQSIGIAARSIEKTPTATQAILAFQELRLADMVDWSRSAAHELWRVVVDGVLGLRRIEDLVRDVADLLDVSAARARTIYDTAVSSYTRQIALLGSTGSRDELFYYVGPVDKVTRPFCLTHVGKVYSRAEVDKLDNGQLPDPLITGGGYNCRHQFKRVSVLDQELRDLHRTGGRLPHIEQRLQQLAEEKRRDKEERRKSA